MIAQKYFSLVERALERFSGARSRDREARLKSVAGRGARAGVSNNFSRFAQVRSDWKRIEERKGGPTLIAEEWREDPLIVTLDAVVSEHRIFFAAACNTDEWTT